MSDQRTHVEIEDVLSSIRRLVSQDGVPPRRTGLFRAAESPFRAPVLEPAPAPVAPETLVLTPALRVAAPVPEIATFDAAPDPEPDTAYATDAVANRAEADGYIEDAAGQAELPRELSAIWHPEGGALSLESALAADPADHEDDEAEPADLVFAPDWQMPETSAAPDLRDELSRLETTIAELEAAVAASDEAFEAERGDPFAGAAEAHSLAAVFAAPLATPAPAPEPPAAAQAEAVQIELEQAEPQPAEPELPAPETLAAAQPQNDLAPELAEPQPDPALRDDPAPMAVDWVDPLDPAEAELTASDWADEEPEAALAAAALAEAAQPRRLHLADAQPEAPRSAPPRSSYAEMQAAAEDDLFGADSDSLFDEPDALIDEDALRAMVSEIIRQELQGTLGERITRSVRKLVRREIARALASRDFE